VHDIAARLRGVTLDGTNKAIQMSRCHRLHRSAVPRPLAAQIPPYARL